MTPYRWRYRADEPRRSGLLAFVAALPLPMQVEHRHSINLECMRPLVGRPLAVMGGRFEMRSISVRGVRPKLLYLFDPKDQQAEITLLGYVEEPSSSAGLVEEARWCLGHVPEPVEIL
jgi:hypothetical protein